MVSKYRNQPLHNCWQAMNLRCLNPNHPRHHQYGGRGITVCDRWRSYESFAADVGPHPGKGWSLDRIDNSKGYEPENVRWATAKEQSRNSRHAKLNITLASKIRDAYKSGATQTELAHLYGVSQGNICRVIHEEIWV